MKKHLKILIIGLIFIIIYYLFIYINRFDIISILPNTIPLQNFYHLHRFSLFFYLYPFLFIIILINILYNKEKTIIYLVIFSLLEVVGYIPFLSPDNYYYILYLFIYIPVFHLFFLAIYLFLFSNTTIKGNEEKKNNKHYPILILFPLLLLLFNFIPNINTNYLIGSDIYFHAKVTNDLIFNNPFFYEIKNILYPKLGYLLIYITKDFLGINNILVWKFVNPVFSFFISLFILILLKRTNINKYGIFLSFIFILPLNQIFLVDPSIRIIAYLTLFSGIYLLSLKKYILLPIFLLSTLLIHYEIFIHFLLIIFFYYTIMHIIKYKNIFLSKLNINFSRIKNILKWNKILLILIIILIILSFLIFFIINNYILKIISTDIPLSLFFPVGIISFVSFFGFCLYIIDNTFEKDKILFISISFLSSSLIFLYSELWSFYHRYFFETAYIGISILAGYKLSIIIKKHRTIITYLIIFLFIFSIYPIINRSYNYRLLINKSIIQYQNTFDLLLNKKIENSVILVHYNSYLNRFLPLYTNNYIFAGNFHNETNQIISILGFCGGFDMKKECFSRLNLSKDLFSKPTKEKLNNILKRYRVDYLLLSETENIDFMNSDIKENMSFTDKNNDYLIYKVIR